MNSHDRRKRQQSRHNSRRRRSRRNRPKRNLLRARAKLLNADVNKEVRAVGEYLDQHPELLIGLGLSNSSEVDDEIFFYALQQTGAKLLMKALTAAPMLPRPADGDDIA